MSFDQRLWSSTESTERPMILALRLSNCGFSFAMVPSSVVQTGVKSFGCENKTAQELPIQSWNLISPSVVWAVKSGASSPMRMVQPPLRGRSLTHPSSRCHGAVLDQRDRLEEGRPATLSHVARSRVILLECG